MKLRNKKTGEIAIFGEGIVDLKMIGCANVAEMMEAGWEDYEEPKKYYWIDYDGKVKSFIDLYEWQDKMKEIGNYFETKEEAEKAVEKLRAFKRLRDKEFRFVGWTILKGQRTAHTKLVIEAELDIPDSPYDLEIFQEVKDENV